MAVFEGTPDDWQRLDWSLLRDGGVSLYHSSEVLDADVAWLRSYSYVAHEFDCSGWETEADFHDAAAAALAFPDYYGRNLAAFNDCLSDLDVPDEGGLVLVFRHFGPFLRRVPDARHALDSVSRMSRLHLLTGRRFAALVQTDDPDLVCTVGACVVSLNLKESLPRGVAKSRERSRVGSGGDGGGPTGRSPEAE